MNNGYQIFTENDTGRVRMVELSTGEVYDTVNAVLPVGTIVYTPEQQIIYKQRKEKEAENARKKKSNSVLGNFFFTSINESFIGVSPESVTRLIYLNAFIGYDNNRVMLTSRTPMKRKDLPKVLGVSKATVSRFWKEVAPKYMMENGDGFIFSNKNIFTRGCLKNDRLGWYQKFYLDGIKKLYQSTDKENHRKLGYIFKLLPFINIEYNLICKPEDVENTDIDNISLISISDFCQLIGFDVKHVNELINAYRNIRFMVNGVPERFCALSYDGIKKESAKIFINPRVLYGGSNPDKVRVLGAFCR